MGFNSALKGLNEKFENRDTERDVEQLDEK
jgi:hypothetical protein